MNNVSDPFCSGMKIFVIKLICFTLSFFPLLLLADTDGTKQIKTMTVITDDGDRLFVDIPDGYLKVISYSSHGVCWTVDPGRVDLHGGRLSLVGFQLTYSLNEVRHGSIQSDTTLYMPMVFSDESDNGGIDHDMGYMEAKFHHDGTASVEVWREKVSPVALGHFTMRRSSQETSCQRN